MAANVRIKRTEIYHRDCESTGELPRQRKICLFPSQPSVNSLQEQKKCMAYSFFERIGKKMIPTYAGKQYLEYAKQIVKLDQDFRNQIADIKMLKKGSLNIGSTPGRGKRILPEILPIFSKEYPEYDLNVYQETAVKLEEMLRNGEIQVALMTGTEELEKDSNFHVEEISTEEICLIAPKSKHFHGIAKYGFRYPWIDIRQMENEKFIMLNKGIQTTLCNRQSVEKPFHGSKTDRVFFH